MNYCREFFIEDPTGNNKFSYEERKIKKIYVPSIKKGTIGDVKIGKKIGFSEIEDNKEINTLGLEYFIKFSFDNKDVFIFDNHNHAFYFWAESLKEGKFKKGIKLIHIDQHKDMREPDKYIESIDNLEEVFMYTNFNLNVGNFIKPALNLGIFSDVIILDNSDSFNMDIEGDYILDIDLDIFSKDMEYISYDVKMNKIRNLMEKSSIITIATSPFFIDQTYAIDVLKDIFKGK